MPQRFLLNLAVLLLGIASAYSGFVLQIRFHMHHEPRIEAPGWDYSTWTLLHKATSVALLVLVVYHLAINWKWLRVTWTKGLLHKHKRLVALCLVFLTATLTGMGAWAIGALGIGPQVERGIVEFHDKLTVVLTVFLVLHVWTRRRRLFRLTRRGDAGGRSTAGSR